MYHCYWHLGTYYMPKTWTKKCPFPGKCMFVIFFFAKSLMMGVSLLLAPGCFQYAKNVDNNLSISWLMHICTFFFFEIVEDGCMIVMKYWYLGISYMVVDL